MKTMRIATNASNFRNIDEILVSWKVHGSYDNDEDRSRDWQFESSVIATIPEAEDFCAKLAAAIAGAKERQVAIVSAKLEDGEVKAGK